MEDLQPAKANLKAVISQTSEEIQGLFDEDKNLEKKLIEKLEFEKSREVVIDHSSMTV